MRGNRCNSVLYVLSELKKLSDTIHKVCEKSGFGALCIV